MRGYNTTLRRGNKNIFVTSFTAIWLGKDFVFKKVKHFPLSTHAIGELGGEKLMEHFTKKEFQEKKQSLELKKQ